MKISENHWFRNYLIHFIEEAKFSDNLVTRLNRILYNVSWVSEHTAPIDRNLVVAIILLIWTTRLKNT